jgi:hypothetical protein
MSLEPPARHTTAIRIAMTQPTPQNVRRFPALKSYYDRPQERSPAASNRSRDAALLSRPRLFSDEPSLGPAPVVIAVARRAQKSRKEATIRSWSRTPRAVEFADRATSCASVASPTATRDEIPGWRPRLRTWG